MTDWREISLGEIVNIYDYKRVPLSSAERAGRTGPYPYYGAQSVIDHIDDFIFDGRFILVPEDGENLRSRKLPIANFAEGKFWVNNHAHIIQAKPGLANDRFIQSALEALDIAPFVTGAAQPKLSQANLRRIRIAVPPIHYQEAIGRFLDDLDDLIENNRRRVGLLEQMAQAIYREWFVHFRYPGHENVPLVDSPLGPIPEGWDARRLHDVATVVRGRAYRKAELVVIGGQPFVNLKCMLRGGGFRTGGLKRYAGPFSLEQKVVSGDIVLAVTDLTQQREILARATLVPDLGSDFGVISLDVVRIVPGDSLDRLAIFSLLRWSDFSERVKEYANGSTVLHLSPTHVSNGLMLWPSADVRLQFTRIIEPTVGHIDSLGAANDSLSSLQDLLLPKLVTAEIDVSGLDLDALAESVA